MIGTYFFIEVSVFGSKLSSGPISLERYGPYLEAQEAHKVLLDELPVLLSIDIQNTNAKTYTAELVETATVNRAWVNVRTIAIDKQEL